MARVDKRALQKALVRSLEEDATTMSRLAKEAALAATHEENRPESDKDMRSTEASYLARGQMERALDLEHALAVVRATDFRERDEGAVVQAGCVVALREATGERLVVLVAAGGGQRVKVGRKEISTVTPQTPLGKALLGLEKGDEVEVQAGGGRREVTIEDVY